MSEFDVMTTSKDFLGACMEIEGLCADLYHYYSDIFEDTPEASRLWKKTALEEESHQKQFELALRLVNEIEFEVPEESLKRAHSIRHKLHNILEHVKSNKPDLLTAVTTAVEMEEKLSHLHVHTSLNFKEDLMQKLFMALNEADHGHITDMQRYRTKLS